MWRDKQSKPANSRANPQRDQLREDKGKVVVLGKPKSSECYRCEGSSQSAYHCPIQNLFVERENEDHRLNDDLEEIEHIPHGSPSDEEDSEDSPVVSLGGMSDHPLGLGNKVGVLQNGEY